MAKKIKFIDLFKALFSGAIGAGIFFLFSIFAFALVKIVYILMNRDLILSRYNIIIAVLLFMFFGLAYGMSCYIRKNSYRKLFKPNWKSVSIDVILTMLFTVSSYLLIRYFYGLMLGYKSVIVLFLLLCICFYLFSSVLTNYLIPRRARAKGHHTRNAFTLVVFNPFFVMIYIWLFLLVAYNSIYIPCGVAIVGIEKNQYTSNTLNLGFQSGEKIVSIDSMPISSVQDVKRYMHSLDATKEITLETDRRIYYVHTYNIDDVRYMGLLLRQDYCIRKY